jgi:membrane-anchored protein YejM (alkaline phosphatase superfamily)
LTCAGRTRASSFSTSFPLTSTHPLHPHQASVENCGADHAKCAWSGDLWTSDAQSFISQNAEKQRSGNGDDSKPFFLYLAYTTPHAGSVGSLAENDVPVPNVSKGPYASQPWPSVEKDFATAVYELDAAVGKVLSTLDKEGLANDTLVIFSSDNGAHNEGGHNYLFFNR